MYIYLRLWHSLIAHRRYVTVLCEYIYIFMYINIYHQIEKRNGSKCHAVCLENCRPTT